MGRTARFGLYSRCNTSAGSQRKPIVQSNMSRVALNHVVLPSLLVSPSPSTISRRFLSLRRAWKWKVDMRGHTIVVLGICSETALAHGRPPNNLCGMQISIAWRVCQGFITDQSGRCSAPLNLHSVQPTMVQECDGQNYKTSANGQAMSHPCQGSSFVVNQQDPQ